MMNDFNFNIKFICNSYNILSELEMTVLDV